MSDALSSDPLDAGVTAAPGGVRVAVRVIPRAARTEIAGIRNGSLLVRLAAPPVDGAANDALITFLATVFDLPRRAVILSSGQHSREKRVMVEGVTLADARRVLKSLMT